MNSQRAYRALLRLYPHDYKERFAAEMLSTFEQRATERRRKSRPTFFGFVIAELIGALSNAGLEWIAKLTTDRAVRGRCLPDLRMMRPPGVPRELWFSSDRKEQASPSALRLNQPPTRVA